MVDWDRQTGDDVRARRKRRLGIGLHVLMLAIGAMYLLAFMVVLRTGYLSWIGVLVGTLLTFPGVVSPILRLAGWKRFSAVLGQVSVGLTFLTAIVLQVSLIRTKNDNMGDWRPYRFDAELAAIEAARAVPDADNAALRYESVFAVMDMDDQPDFLFRGDSLLDEFAERPWKGEDHPRAAEWLDSYSRMIAELLAVGGMEECRWPVQADTYDGYTVPYEKLRRSVLILMADGSRDLGEGRIGEALTKYLGILRIADHLHQQSSVVDSLMSFGLERDALGAIRHVLVQGNLFDADIAQIAHGLPPTADSWPQEWERLLEHDKLHYMNLLGRLYEADREGNTRFAGKIVISPRDEREQTEPTWIPRAYWLLSMPLDPRAVRGIVDRYFAGFEDQVTPTHLPQPARDGQFFGASLCDFCKMACNPYRWGLEMMFFNEQKYLEHCRRRAPAITGRRGTWLVLGLRRYQAVNGMWPNALDEISPHVPPEAFSDPTSGGAFVYSREGGSFRLYSKGFNGIDEGGRHGYVRALDKTEDDIDLWPPVVEEPESDDEGDTEELFKLLEQAYGRDYVEAMFGVDSNDE